MAWFCIRRIRKLAPAHKDDLQVPPPTVGGPTRPPPALRADGRARRVPLLSTRPRAHDTSEWDQLGSGRKFIGAGSWTVSTQQLLWQQGPSRDIGDRCQSPEIDTRTVEIFLKKKVKNLTHSWKKEVKI
jgi:hypothetical protein